MLDYVIFQVQDKEYELRLNARGTIKLEEALGKNPLAIFNNEDMPTLQEIMLVMFYSLQPNHRNEFKNIDAVYDLYDEFIDAGGTLAEIIPLILDIYKTCGLVPKDIKVEEKNA